MIPIQWPTCADFNSNDMWSEREWKYFCQPFFPCHFSPMFLPPPPCDTHEYGIVKQSFIHTPDLLLFTESDLSCCLFSKTPKASESQRTFGGFKRGFLTNPQPRKVNSTHSSKSAKESADMPVIRPKNPEHKTKGIEIPEVQEAMKSSIPSLENKGN